MIWVLDASIAVKWFFLDEPLRDLALKVRDRLCERPREFVVPHLFWSEMLHVLARKSGGDEVFVASGVDLLLRLGLRVLPLTATALRRAAEWAARGLSGYDASYVALAEDLAGRWLTADDRAARKVGVNASLKLAAWELL